MEVPMRYLLPAILLSLCGALLPSLEEGSILISPNPDSDRLMTFDAATGMIRVYRSRGGRGEEALDLQSSHNFIYDIDQLTRITATSGNPIAKLAKEQPPEIDYPLLQLGKNTSPTFADQFDQRRPCFSLRQADPTRDSEYVAAFKAELSFWGGEDLAYDGRAWAAMSEGYIMVFVPSHYAILLYNLVNDELQLKAYRNVRPEWMVRIADGFPYLSYPEFNTLKTMLKQAGGGRDLLAQAAHSVALAFAKMEEAEQVKLLGQSDAFLGSMSNERFVLLDLGSQRLAVYQFARDLELVSLRNLELDLMLPSWPLPRNDIDAIAKLQVYTYMQRLRSTKQSAEVDEVVKRILTWSAEKQFKYLKVDDQVAELLFFRTFPMLRDQLLAETGGTTRPWDAAVVTTNQGQQLVLDLKSSRRLLVYDLSRRGNKIELMTAQAYDIDTAMTDYSEILAKRIRAAQFFEATQQRCRTRGYAKWILKRVEYLLKIAPEYAKTIEADPALKQWQRNLELWDKDNPADQLVAKYQAMMEKAVQAVAAQKAGWDKLVTSMQEALIRREEAMVLAKEGKLPDKAATEPVPAPAPGPAPAPK
jgi:hypothetical protein